MIYLQIRIGYWEVENPIPEESYKIGTTVEEFNNGYYIPLNEEQIAFHNSHPEASYIEVINAKLNPPHVITIDEARTNKIIEIKQYDESGQINVFYLDDNALWYSKEDRLLIKDRCERCIENGITSIPLQNYETSITDQDPRVVLAMINDMCSYADACYDNTQSKYEEVGKKQTVEEVQSIDVTTGYPEIVHDTTDEIKLRLIAKDKNSEELQVINLVKMQINSMTLSNEQAITVKVLYPEWESFIGKELPKGYRVRYQDRLYNVRMLVNPVLENQPPSIVTSSLYEEIDEVHSGDMYDPIHYNNNMELFEGKYYIQDGVLYKCIRNTGTPVYNTLADLVGIYVELVEQTRNIK